MNIKSIAPTIARSGTEEDIIAAAEERARLWKYNPDGHWTVTVVVGKREVEVYKAYGQAPRIVRR